MIKVLRKNISTRKNIKREKRIIDLWNVQLVKRKRYNFIPFLNINEKKEKEVQVQ